MRRTFSIPGRIQQREPESEIMNLMLLYAVNVYSNIRVSCYCMLSAFIAIYESYVTVCCQNLLQYTSLMLLYAEKIYCNIRVSCYCMLSKFIAIYESHVTVCCQSL